MGDRRTGISESVLFLYFLSFFDSNDCSSLLSPVHSFAFPSRVNTESALIIIHAHSFPYVLVNRIRSDPHLRRWSFGVTAFALYTGRIPFSGKDYAEQKRAITSGDYDFSTEKDTWTKLESLVAHFLQVKPHSSLELHVKISV